MWAWQQTCQRSYGMLGIAVVVCKEIPWRYAGGVQVLKKPKAETGALAGAGKAEAAAGAPAAAPSSIPAFLQAGQVCYSILCQIVHCTCEEIATMKIGSVFKHI